MNLAARVWEKVSIWFMPKSAEERTNEVIVRSMDDDAKESFWLELKEFSKAHVFECATFIGFVLFGVYCIFNTFGFVGTNELRLRSDYYEKLIIDHCQFPETRVLNGTEGLSDHPNATLVSLLAVVRHGDRYGMRRSKAEDCQILSEHEEKFFDEYLSVASKQKLLNRFNMAPDLDDVKNLPKRNVCKSRDLTPRGAIQGFEIGRYLSDKYKKTRLFNSSETSINLTITSSGKYPTVASAIAVVSGLLDQNHTRFKSPIDFKAAKLDYGCTDPGCNCDANFEKMKKLVRKEREGMFRMEATGRTRKVVELISGNKSVDHLTEDPDQILDFLMTEHSCQRQALPCDHEHCVSYLFVGDLIELRKAQSSKRFESDVGVERQYRVISAFPILRSLGLMIGSNRREVQLFASHDAIIASILRTLTDDGNHTDLQVYGARIIFEIYETPKKTRMFRVVYNGDDITSSLPFCRNLENGLCPAAELQKFVDKGIFELAGFHSFEESCNSL